MKRFVLDLNSEPEINEWLAHNEIRAEHIVKIVASQYCVYIFYDKDTGLSFVPWTPSTPSIDPGFYQPYPCPTFDRDSITISCEDFNNGRVVSNTINGATISTATGTVSARS